MKVQTERKTGFSSSKILAVMGYNPFRTATEQWLIDTKQMTVEMTESGLQKTKMGNLMEPIIKQAVEDEIGKELYFTKERYMHDDYDFLTIEFDALDTEEEIVYEFKNTEYDEDHLIDMYYPQVQSAMAITGYKKAKICYLKDGWRLGMIDVERDENFIEHMIKVGAYYIECVRNMVAPDESYIAELVAPIDFFKQYEKTPPEILDLEKKDVELLYEWADLKKQIAQLQTEEERIKGDFAEKYGKFSDGDVTYTNQEYSKKGGYDMQRLKYDYPDIDFEAYRKKDSTYKRQMLKVKHKPGSEDIII
jgi:predicted phage-related endonuclease